MGCVPWRLQISSIEHLLDMSRHVHTIFRLITFMYQLHCEHNNLLWPPLHRVTESRRIRACLPICFSFVCNNRNLCQLPVIPHCIKLYKPTGQRETRKACIIAKFIFGLYEIIKHYHQRVQTSGFSNIAHCGLRRYVAS